jgi:phage protein U
MVSISGIVATGAALLGLGGGGGMIGSFGPCIFRVSSNHVKTFSQLARRVEMRYADHEVISQKPVSEFTGAGLDEITLTILLDADLGVSPLTEMAILRLFAEMGTASYLQLAGFPLGQFTIRGLEETWTYMIGGMAQIIELSLTIKEYVDTVPTTAQSKQAQDQASRAETGKGGPEKLPGSSPAGQARNLTRKSEYPGWKPNK